DRGDPRGPGSAGRDDRAARLPGGRVRPGPLRGAQTPAARTGPDRLRRVRRLDRVADPYLLGRLPRAAGRRPRHPDRPAARRPRRPAVRQPRGAALPAARHRAALRRAGGPTVAPHGRAPAVRRAGGAARRGVRGRPVRLGGAQAGRDRARFAGRTARGTAVRAAARGGRGAARPAGGLAPRGPAADRLPDVLRPVHHGPPRRGPGPVAGAGGRRERRRHAAVRPAGPPRRLARPVPRGPRAVPGAGGGDALRGRPPPLRPGRRRRRGGTDPGGRGGAGRERVAGDGRRADADLHHPREGAPVRRKAGRERPTAPSRSGDRASSVSGGGRGGRALPRGRYGTGPAADRTAARRGAVRAVRRRRDPPAARPDEVTVGTTWGGNRVPEFAVAVAGVLVTGDEETAGALCDGRTVTVMWLALADRPDPMSDLRRVRLDDSTSGSAVVISQTEPLSMTAAHTEVVRELLERPRDEVAAKVRDHWAELTAPEVTTDRAAELLGLDAPEEADECL
ncbi:LOW QUALITY PROTEIN: conserved hypothetical protein, partial [Streptomyces viridosporus ATCC 14672]